MSNNVNVSNANANDMNAIVNAPLSADETTLLYTLATDKIAEMITGFSKYINEMMIEFTDANTRALHENEKTLKQILSDSAEIVKNSQESIKKSSESNEEIVSKLDTLIDRISNISVSTNVKENTVKPDKLRKINSIEVQKTPEGMKNDLKEIYPEYSIRKAISQIYKKMERMSGIDIDEFIRKNKPVKYKLYAKSYIVYNSKTLRPIFDLAVAKEKESIMKGD